MEIANYILFFLSISGLIYLLWLFTKNELTLEPISLFKIFLKLNKIMANIQELSAKVDTLQAALDAEQEQIQAAIATLQATVDQLRQDVVDGGTAEERQAVADKIDAVIVDLQGTIADAPVEPTEPTE